MTSAHSRKKQPEAVRLALLESAMRIAAEEGIGGVTVQAVAAASGVTKGGLFHHFANKQALMEGMIGHVLAKLEAAITAAMQPDPEPYGRFTRAYVATLVVGEEFGLGSPFDALSVAMMADPSLGHYWMKWFTAFLARHADTDNAPVLEIVRLAADGVWMKYLGTEPDRAEVLALRDQLFAMTRKPE